MLSDPEAALLDLEVSEPGPGAFVDAGATPGAEVAVPAPPEGDAAG